MLFTSAIKSAYYSNPLGSKSVPGSKSKNDSQIRVPRGPNKVIVPTRYVTHYQSMGWI